MAQTKSVTGLDGKGVAGAGRSDPPPPACLFVVCWACRCCFVVTSRRVDEVAARCVDVLAVVEFVSATEPPVTPEALCVWRSGAPGHFRLAFKAGDLLFHHDNNISPVRAIRYVIASAVTASKREHQQDKPGLPFLPARFAVERAIQGGGDIAHQSLVFRLDRAISDRMALTRH